MCAIIYKRDCNRYALKRKVADGMSGNFRGVCPILNRANQDINTVCGYGCAGVHSAQLVCCVMLARKTK